MNARRSSLNYKFVQPPPPRQREWKEISIATTTTTATPFLFLIKNCLWLGNDIYSLIDPNHHLPPSGVDI